MRRYTRKMRFILTWLLVLCLGMSMTALAEEASPAAEEETVDPAPVQTGTGQQTPVLLSSAPFPEIAAASACLMEARTGTLLYSKNADDIYYPASTTKVLTALVVLENCDNLQDIVTFSDAAVNGIDPESSRAGLMVGEQLTVEQALYGLMLRSGNDCAVALAEYIAGSEAAFADMMNEKAREIGCTSSHFVNAHGLTDPDHYTTAHDLALIMREAIKNETFTVIDSTYSYEVPSTNLRAEGVGPWYMSNKMINPYNEEYYEGVIGGKTGFTDEALNTLVTYAKRGDLELICTIMKSNSTHYADTKILYDYGFENYRSYNMQDLAQAYTSQDLGFYASLDGSVTRDVLSIEQKGESWVVLPAEVGTENLTAELRYGTENPQEKTQIAELVYTYGDMEVGRTSLLLHLPDRVLPSETAAESVAETAESQGEARVIEATAETKESFAGMLEKAIPVPLPVLVGGLVVLLLLILLLILFFRPSARKRRESRKRRREYMASRKKYY